MPAVALGAVGFVVVAVVPGDFADEIENLGLFAAGDEFLQGTGDRSLLGFLPAQDEGVFQQVGARAGLVAMAASLHIGLHSTTPGDQWLQATVSGQLAAYDHTQPVR